MTLRHEVSSEYKEKGSRFLAFGYPVESLDEVEAKLEALRKTYYDARHHCYAYRLGTAGETWRANDDGEPSHSAGTPILNQLRSQELTNVLVVVIRYFGGTKLGVSGLINAYKTATATALDETAIYQKILKAKCCFVYDYPQTNAVMRIQDQFELSPSHQDFQARCTLCWEVRLSQLEAVKAAVAEVEGVTFLEE